MNPNWLKFLQSQQASVSVNNEIEFPYSVTQNNALFPITSLKILKVSGIDAKQFLQGQLTCNVNELDSENSFFAAFCNPKGRVISSLLIFKREEDFLLLLPASLFDKVKNKLQMYVLRSKVTLTNITEEFCIIGTRLNDFNNIEQPLIKLPSNLGLYIIVTDLGNGCLLWSKLQTEKNCQPQSSIFWEALQIEAGLPWLNLESSEQYIPQMLNIDKLDGISFNKGCYTGQEVIARTHYLGKSKRTLFIATAKTNDIKQFLAVLNSDGDKVGEVLTVCEQSEKSLMLLVLQTEEVVGNSLKLDNTEQSDITIQK